MSAFGLAASAGSLDPKLLVYLVELERDISRVAAIRGDLRGQGLQDGGDLRRVRRLAADVLSDLGGNIDGDRAKAAVGRQRQAQDHGGRTGRTRRLSHSEDSTAKCGQKAAWRTGSRRRSGSGARRRQDTLVRP